jgi:molybdopterin synthase sulfur carrier subunit
MIRVILPSPLQALAHTGPELHFELAAPVTHRAVLDAVEAAYPMLRGTIRDHATQRRRPFIRFHACEQDLSHEPADTPLPEGVTSGREPYLIVGAMSGG